MNFPHFEIIVKSLLRHMGTVLLLIVQIAISMSVILNCYVVVREAVSYSLTRVGIDEANIGIIQSISIIGQQSTSTVANNLAYLKEQPGVISAAFGSVPLAGVPVAQVSRGPDESSSIAINWMKGSQGYSQTLGLHLLSGQMINDTEIPLASADHPTYEALITNSLAAKLFPNEKALGNVLYTVGSSFRIKGIIEDVNVHLSGTPSDRLTIVTSQRYTNEDFGGLYIIRSTPGNIRPTLNVAVDTLSRLNPSHVQSYQAPFEQLRDKFLSAQTGPAAVLGAVVVIVALMIGFSISGLTTLWARQRRVPMGIRRALGAKRSDIVTYFLAENFLLVFSGCFAGTFGAYLLNSMLRTLFEINRLGVMDCVTVALFIILVGQIFALPAAIGASCSEPAKAIRRL
jgi:putative ABC transport system permease protein